MAGGPWQVSAPSSGNRAFDEYRTETLRRLEDEQREFRDFLERLRFAKDKTEFDQFMAERRNRRSPGRRTRRRSRPEALIRRPRAGRPSAHRRAAVLASEASGLRSCRVTSP